MPHSNDKLEGFENKIAELLAKDFGAPTRYTWWGQRRGFIRNTMNATLEEGRCDVVIGVPEGYDLVSTTKPYYRSTYVFVYPRDKGPQIKSLDDPVLKKWPDLLADMRAASIRNYTIFADGPELFGYLECDDWDAAAAALARSDANRRWQELMGGYLATPVDPGAAEPLRVMEEVFRMA